ncbi:uncharacterized protein LOC121418109 [Lytechinus variegatus]|uniref:uncharacterized protein LOC121418109 n=1 Tax=Lytechinus variegatus TaxID=7654 RepID=UPI001BB1A0A5|nr:uncharacterized protein LOC121418109 [Lytechinus variegatus]
MNNFEDYCTCTPILTPLNTVASIPYQLNIVFIMSSSCSCFCISFLQKSRVFSTVLIIVLFTANEAFMTAVVPVAPEVLLHLCYTTVYRTVCQNVTKTGLFTLSDCLTYQQTHYSNNPQDFTFTNVSKSNADSILDLLQDCHERLSFQNGLLLATKFLMRILLTAPASWLIDKVGIFWPFFFSTLLALIACLRFLGGIHAILG